MNNSPGETAFVRWRLRRTVAALGLAGVSIRPFDFLYPMTPPPLVTEVAGSRLITATKPVR